MERCGKWHTLYPRLNRWAKSGVLARVFPALPQQQTRRVRVAVVALESPVGKGHPAGMGARKKLGRQPSASPAAGGRPSFLWLPRLLIPL